MTNEEVMVKVLENKIDYLIQNGKIPTDILESAISKYIEKNKNFKDIYEFLVTALKNVMSEQKKQYLKNGILQKEFNDKAAKMFGFEDENIFDELKKQVEYILKNE